VGLGILCVVRRLVLDRLELRPFTARDAGAAHDVLYGDPEVMRYVAEGPLSNADATSALVGAYAQRAVTHAWSFWAVCERDSGALIGDAGMWPSDRGEPELGYTLARSAWGRGYATEAARAVVDLAFGEAGLDHVVALTHPDNSSSMRVLTKLGFDRVGTRDAHGYEHVLFRLDRPA
jgi:RimJ/RimL family protein N-acetyltransferase